MTGVAARRSDRSTAYRALVMVVLSLGCVSTAGTASAAGSADDRGAPDVAAVDAFVEGRLDATDLRGVAVALVHGREVVHVRGYGTDSAGVPVTGDTPFRVASVSKSFTALAVMQLVERGSVRLDEPVRTYLPGFRTSDRRSDRISVRQLLDQTSGMADTGFPEVSLPQPDTLAGAVERLRAARLVADPGTTWNYHNPNYQVAARLVEVVSGETFAGYVQRHIFGPLAMDRSSSTATDDEAVPGLADGHSSAYGRAVPCPGRATSSRARAGSSARLRTWRGG